MQTKLSIHSAINKLKDFRTLGEKILDDGTQLIGKAPQLAPMTWLHSVYTPLKEDEIKDLEIQTGLSIPMDYRAFLRISNGLSVFSTTLNFFGFRKNFGRNVSNVWQPLDIVIPNAKERMRNRASNSFIIGCYDCENTQIYIDCKTSKVYLSRYENPIPLYEWKSLEDMLETEIIRLIKLFEKEGMLLRSVKSTLPI